MAAVDSGATHSEPQALDRYRSLFEIGKGGMGSVEVALERGEGGFERVVALKRMLPEAAREPRRTEMFLREARLAALLLHPNVVHAFAFGEAAGEPFLAMEYVEGEPLSHVLQAAREARIAIDPRLAAHLVAEVCEGLHAAHELVDENGVALNLIHRDVSPHNVMVAYDGHVKLLDFGVAKVETMGGVTRTGEVKGKTGYMSPEQAMGEALDRRSDLFSVGAVLFECVTGERMWGSGTDLEVLRRLALEAPPRLEDARADAPKALCDLHARLVARSPEGRPLDAHAVARELRSFSSEHAAEAATSEGAAPDARAVGALMARLFAKESAARKRALDDALASADPARAPVLRATLSSLPPAPASGASEAARGRTRTPRRGLVVVAIAALAAGGALALTMQSRGAKPEIDRAASATAMPVAPDAKRADEALKVASPDPIAPAATATSRATAATIAPAGPLAKPPRPAASASTPRTKPAPKGAPSGPIDVDPEPF